MLFRIPLRIVVAAAAIAAAGCQSVVDRMPNILKPYEPDVQQGNVVTKEMVEQLTAGMTREQVRFLLGTPALASVFHQDRWDYVYRLKRGNSNEIQARRLVVYFKDNRLERFESDEMPNEALADNLILGRNPKSLPKPPPAAAAPIRSREVDPRTEIDIISPTSPTGGL